MTCLFEDLLNLVQKYSNKTDLWTYTFTDLKKSIPRDYSDKPMLVFLFILHPVMAIEPIRLLRTTKYESNKYTEI